MTIFKSFLFFELRRSLTRLNGVVAILFFVGSMYLTLTGVKQYYEIKKNKEEFIEIEKLKIERLNNYDQYGGYGFRLYFMPSALSIFFNNSNLFTELTAHIDIREKLNIDDSFKGKKVFAQKPGRWRDFSGILLLFGSLMALFYGYDSLRHIEYLKFLASIHGHRKVYFLVWFSRMTWLSLYFIIVSASALLLTRLFRITFTAGEYLYFLIFVVMILLLMSFFFSWGTFTSSLKTKLRLLLIFLIWFGFVYFLPVVINTWGEVKSEKIKSNYQYELNIFADVMNFEVAVNEKTKEESKRLKDVKDKNVLAEKLSKIRDEMMQYYDRGILPKIQNYEKDIADKMLSIVKYIETLSGLFPSTFYLFVNDETSSRGYENVIAFHEYTRMIKGRFWEFYRPRKQAELDATARGIRPERVEPFFVVRNDLKNVFEGKSRLPDNFWVWFAITLTWILWVGLRSYLLYKNSLFPKPKTEIAGGDELEIELTKGESNVVLSRHEAVGEHLYNVLSGKDRGFKGKLIYNGIDLVSKKERSEFVYLCHPQEIPGDIGITGFVSFMGKTLKVSKEQLQDLNKRLNLNEYKGKKFSDLPKDKNDIKGKILFEVARLKKTAIYMIDDFARGMPPAFLKEFTEGLDELKLEGSAILYLTNDLFLARKIGDYVSVTKEDAALITTSF